MSERTRRCAVLGRPIGHSLSPVLHRAGYAATGLDWTYDAHDVGESELAAFIGGLDDRWRGLSLTMPLKRVALDLLDEVSERAAQAGAVNTVVLDGARRVGHNTDITGAAAAIQERYAGPLETALVLGGGATATSTLLALADLGCRSAIVLVRDPARAEETVRAVARHPDPPRLQVRPLSDGPASEGLEDPVRPVDLVVSTIPAVAQTPELLARVGGSRAVFDVVYDPWPTPLAASARESGRTLVSGLDLLVHQAAEQFTLMTGVDPAPLAAMRAAGEQALAARSVDRR